MEQKTLQDTLNKALEMEEKGYKFYKEVSKKSENSITKKTFDFLAKNEIYHIEAIKNFYKTLKESGEFPTISLENDKAKRSQDLSIFSKNLSELNEKVKPSDDDKKACEFAMEFENNGYRYYENMLKDAKDKALIKLLEFLLKEENAHYESIKSLYTYITDSHNWFMYEEGSFPQG